MNVFDLLIYTCDFRGVLFKHPSVNTGHFQTQDPPQNILKIMSFVRRLFRRRVILILIGLLVPSICSTRLLISAQPADFPSVPFLPGRVSGCRLLFMGYSSSRTPTASFATEEGSRSCGRSAQEEETEPADFHC